MKEKIRVGTVIALFIFDLYYKLAIINRICKF